MKKNGLITHMYELMEEYSHNAPNKPMLAMRWLKIIFIIPFS